MAGPRRTRGQRELDLQRIAEMYCRGLPQSAIARQIGVSRQQISYDLRALRKRWLQNAMRDFDARAAEELAKIDHLEMEYWRAYEQAQRAKRFSAPYLAGVMSCIERRCKLFGLDAPTKIAPTDPSGENPYAGMSDEQLLSALVETTRAIARSGALSLDADGEAQSEDA